ncbi:MAG: hypothetical protein EPO16_07145, partial [Dehalococcoidia bacterium]
MNAQTTARTFSGTFAGAGTFNNSICTWRTTYTGSVTMTLTFSSSSVSGTARHQGSYQDALTNGPAECGGDVSRFDETVTVSGTAQNLRWGFGHGESGSVAVTASLVGNAIVGRGVVTDPEYTGSATIPFTFNEVGGSPPPSNEESAPAPSPSATTPPAPAATAATPVALVSAPPRASATTTAAPSAQPSQPPSSSSTTRDATVVPISPVPAVPPPRDVDPNPRITREMCQDFSSDPALWQALEDHLSELDELEVPIGTAKSCITLYRAQPWAQRPGGSTLVKPGDEAKKDETGARGDKPEDAPKATIETEKAVLLRAGERSQPTLVRGARLGAGDALVTRDEPATVAFSEGSRMELGPKSAVVMGDPAEKAVVQLRGRLFMDIKSRQWTVRIPQPRGLVSVVTRGTQFSTEVLADGNVRVEVTESAVEVTSGGAMVVVPAGASIVVDPGAVPPQPAQSPKAAAAESRS